MGGKGSGPRVGGLHRDPLLEVVRDLRGVQRAVSQMSLCPSVQSPRPQTFPAPKPSVGRLGIWGVSALVPPPYGTPQGGTWAGDSHAPASRSHRFPDGRSPGPSPGVPVHPASFPLKTCRCSELPSPGIDRRGGGREVGTGAPGPAPAEEGRPRGGASFVLPSRRPGPCRAGGARGAGAGPPLTCSPLRS